MARLRKGLLMFNMGLGVLAILLFIIGLMLVLHSKPAFAEAQVQEAEGIARARVVGWGFLSAAIAVGFSCIGAGIAVSVVGSAAMGAVAERPELMGRSLIYVGLAEGIAIYGLVVAIMILGKI